MLNLFVIEGKIKKISKLQQTENGTKFLKIKVESKRSFTNKEGKYDIDLMEIELWRSNAETILENCKNGNLISIQGRIQATPLKTKDKKEYIAYTLVGEKINYLK